MAKIGAKWQVSRSFSVVLFSYLLATVFVSAERSINNGASRFNGIDQQPLSNDNNNNSFIFEAMNSLWLSHQTSDDEHIWPEMKFGWPIIVGTIIAMFGAGCGSIGGIGGGSIFVPMLTLVIGFDQKSAIALSKCMIMGSSISTVYFNLKQRHPTLDLPMIDYDLVLLIQPMLMLGISMGVSLSVVFADWMVIALLIPIVLGTAIRVFFKGVETWKTETIIKREAAKILESNDSENGEAEYKLLSGGPSSKTQKETTKPQKVRILGNIYWKELGLLLFVWVGFLVLQIAKNQTTNCSMAYWLFNLLQIPISLAVYLYEAIGLYKGQRVIASLGDHGRRNWRILELALCPVFGFIGGMIGGLLGIGGGFVMGPLFLELGVPPQVSSASALLGMTFSSSMSVVEYYLLNRFPVPYALYFIVGTAIAAYVGQMVMKKVIAIFGRASLIIFILVFTATVGTITLGGVRLVNMIEMIERNEYMGFEDLCKN